MKYPDDFDISIGTSSDIFMVWETTSATDHFIMGLPTGGKIKLGTNVEIVNDLQGDSCPIKTASYNMEENADLDDASYEWSYGNGSTGNDSGILMPCDGKVVAMTVNCANQTGATSTVEVRIDQTGTDCETDIDTAGGAGNFYGIDKTCTDTFIEGQLITFYTIDDDGACSDCQGTFYVQFN